MLLLLLPGMDGTGLMFNAFVPLLPAGCRARVVPYPTDQHLTYEQLAQHVRQLVPHDEPYVIIAESYSGPVAALLAARPTGDLRALVLVASFVAFPAGRLARSLARYVPAAIFRYHTPGWLLRWVVADSSTPAQTIADLHRAIARVGPHVFARRLQEAMQTDFSDLLSRCPVRIVCLTPRSDRLLGGRGHRSIVAARPDAENASIPGPHFLLQCAPAECVAALEALGLFVG